MSADPGSCQPGHPRLLATSCEGSPLGAGDLESSANRVDLRPVLDDLARNERICSRAEVQTARCLVLPTVDSHPDNASTVIGRARW